MVSRKAKQTTGYGNSIGAQLRWCIGDTGTQCAAGIGKPEKRDHIVLIDAIAGDADCTYQRHATKYWHAPGKNLDAVGCCRKSTAGSCGYTRDYIGHHLGLNQV